jgi:membrane-associated phospholipid phosphatase
MNIVSKDAWLLITSFGSADAALLIVSMAAMGLWLDDRRRVVIVWLAALTVGVLIASSTVVAFAGWGLGIAALDFTGVSGHAMLACAVLPVALACMFCSRMDRNGMIGLGVGMLLGLLVGWSRITLGAHSWSEVAFGGGLGGVISCAAWWSMRKGCDTALRLRWTKMAVLPCIVLVLSMHQTMATVLPAHDWVTRFALVLSGHDRPYVRGDLHTQ